MGAVPATSPLHGEILSRQGEIIPLLPRHVPLEKFLACASAAIQNNPDLALVEKRILWREVAKAAVDGLMPDGREGVINVYNEKYKEVVNGRDEWKWRKSCCWIPMTYGLRKRAMELAGVVIDAQVVNERDEFEWEKGSRPFIRHKPVPLSTDPGKVIGAYAVFRRGEELLHHEVLRTADMEKIRSVVKAQNGLMWTTFVDEAWKKSAVRRGIKTVPAVLPPEFHAIATRNDDQFEFANREAASPALPPRAPSGPALPPRTTTPSPALPPRGEAAAEPQETPTATAAHIDRPHIGIDPGTANYKALAFLDDILTQAVDMAELNRRWEKNEQKMKGAFDEAEMKAAYRIYDHHEQRIMKPASEATVAGE